MAKKDPNKLLYSRVLKFSDDPLLGALILDTDHGVIHFAVNRAVTLDLIKNLTDFLDHPSPEMTKSPDNPPVLP